MNKDKDGDIYFKFLDDFLNVIIKMVKHAQSLCIQFFLPLSVWVQSNE